MSKGERRKRERERGREKGRKETKGQVVKDIVCDEWPLNLTALFQVFKIVVLSLCGNRSEGMLCDCPMLGWSGGAAGQFSERYFWISQNLYTHKHEWMLTPRSGSISCEQLQARGPASRISTKGFIEVHHQQDGASCDATSDTTIWQHANIQALLWNKPASTNLECIILILEYGCLCVSVRHEKTPTANTLSNG